MMKWFPGVLVLSIMGLAVAAGETLFQCTFAPEEMKGVTLPPVAAIVKDGDEAVLKITVPEGYKKSTRVAMPCDFSKAAGKGVILSYQVKCTHVPKPEKAHYGAVVLLIYRTPDGKTHYNQVAGAFGSGDWQAVERRFAIPPGAGPGEICFLLSKVSGEAQFSEVKLSLVP